MTTDYVTYVTSEHRERPNFTALLTVLTVPFSEIATTIASLPAAFSLDTAVGVQLDDVGRWVGITRNLDVPLPNASFSWNIVGLGWNEANWKGPFEPSEGIVTLDDTLYRLVLRAKIASNYWDGTLGGANVIAQTAFLSAGVSGFIIDNQDMSIDVVIVGTASAALAQLIKQGVLPPITAGVGVGSYTFAGNPAFALDALTSALMAGLDIGAFLGPLSNVFLPRPIVQTASQQDVTIQQPALSGRSQ